MGTFDWDLESICREDECCVSGVHPKHALDKPIDPKPDAKRRPIRVHHRPDPKAIQLPPPAPAGNKKPAWQKDDPDGLTGSVARATSKSNPVYLTEIVNFVRDDYGNVTERTVYRHVRKLVERKQLVKMELGLPMAAYLRPGSRLLREPEVVREIMLDRLDMARYGEARP